MLRQAQPRTRLLAITRPEYGQVDAVGYDAAIDSRRGKDRSLDPIHEPLRGSRHVEAALREDLLLPLPVASRRVALDGGRYAQVRALAAACFPPLAVERMGAVAGEQPHVRQSQDHGDPSAQADERSEVEESPVQVIAVQNVRLRPPLLKESVRRREVEILHAEPRGQRPSRLADHLERHAQPARSAHSANCG